MRICQVMSLPMPPEDGMGNYVYNLSRQLVNKGHEVTIITRGDGRHVQIMDYGGIAVYKVPFMPLYPVHVQFHGMFVKRLLGKIGQDFDVMHYHTPLPPAVKVKAPVVTTVHGTNERFKADRYPLTTVLQSKFNYFNEKKLYAISDKVIAVSSSIEKDLINAGLDGGKVKVINNAVDENKFYPCAGAGGEKYVLFVGRLIHGKGVFDFIRAGFEICDSRKDVNFKIIGSGPLLSEVSGMVRRSKYGDRFEVLGHMEHEKLAGLYQNATIFVIPSYHEGLPTTLLEAMSCGLPVIATGVSGNVDVVEHEKNGILVPAKSVDLLSRAISELLNDEGKRRYLGKMARQSILDKYTWDKISDKYIRCYEELLACD